MPANFSSAEEAARWAEDELKRLVGTFNDEVVPAIRKDGGRALRLLSEKLTRIAEHLESR